MLKSDVVQCQFSNWYTKFRECTFESKVINLSSEVVDYLLADGLVLPDGCEDNLQRRGLEGDSDDEVDWESDVEEAQGPKFPDFNKKLESAINALDGKIFPKLNWSSPKDATWIAMENNLKCTCPRDIYLLLKSSDFISHDLTHPFDRCLDACGDCSSTIQYQLVLRKWHNINPSGEFRCFVNNNKLIGICQRQHTAYFPGIPTEQEKISSDVAALYIEKIQGKFPLSNYVFDIYRPEENKVYLVDFNPYGPTTDSLLFNWEELLCDKPLDIDVKSQVNSKPVFRCVESQGQVQSSPYQCYAMPQDFVHLTTGEDPKKLIDFLKMKRQSQNDSSTDEDD